MLINVRLSQLRSSGGEILEFPPAGVTCIVGGNNVGKSRMLREIDTALFDPASTAVTFNELKITKPFIDASLAEQFLETIGVKLARRDGYPQQYMPMSAGQGLDAEEFLYYYQSVNGPAIQAAKYFFAWYASAGSLVSAASGGIGNVAMDGGGHPLYRLFRDGRLEQELSDLSLESFGVPLTLDRLSGDVRLRVGTVGIEVPPLNRPTKEYADAVLGLPQLEQQGDGIKSFLGLALNVLAGSAQILLIDEPEAFLHPSQARTLGRWLGNEAVKRDIQVVLSTHDRDLLLGLIDSEASSVVNVVRITRDDTVNHLYSLSHEEIAATWNDPVLRYSNVLQGLFHRKVAISESDGDCRFYGAVLDSLGADKGRRAVADDVLFVPSGGKQRVAAMASALTHLGVETFAIVDFDIFRKRADVKAVVEGLGGEWSSEMDAAYVAIADAANQRSLWDYLKNHGFDGLPSGLPHVAGRTLVGLLRDSRVLVVPVGEMEDFDKSIGLHGAAWVSEMLANGNHKLCQAARDMLTPLLS